MCRRWDSNPHEVALTGFFESVTELPSNPHRYHQKRSFAPPHTEALESFQRAYISDDKTRNYAFRNSSKSRLFSGWVLARKLMHTNPLTVSPEPHSEKRLSVCSSGARGHEQIRETFFNLELGWRGLLLRICPRRRRRHHARLG
jgi:hypothetical protein